MAIGAAGCLSSDGSSTSDEKPAENPTDDNSSDNQNNDSSNDGSTNNGEIKPYTVTVKPSGSYTFEEVPETFVTQNWIDETMAYGLQPDGSGAVSRHPTKYYELLPDVEYNPEEIHQVGGRSAFTKEFFYKHQPDVILMDERYFKVYSKWEDKDIEIVENRVAPILGSLIHMEFMGHEPYYSLYEVMEKIAKIFQRQPQYEAWKDFHHPFLDEVQSVIPQDEEITGTVLINGVSPDKGKFYPVTPFGKRLDTRTTRQLGIRDAFAGMDIKGAVGYEALLKADPDYIIAPSLGYSYEGWQKIVQGFKNDALGSQLSAVQNENLIRVSGHYMGAIIDMFSLEAGAKQVYPEHFGEWHGKFTDLSKSEHLFDRQRMSDIINNRL